LSNTFCHRGQKTGPASPMKRRNIHINLFDRVQTRDDVTNDRDACASLAAI
jgi:hypothetical protein